MEIKIKLEVVLPERFLHAFETFCTHEKRLATPKNGRPVDILNITTRSRSVIDRLGIKYIGELEYISEKMLLRTQNAGPATLNEIKKECAQYGVILGRLADQLPPHAKPENIETILSNFRGELNAQ